MSKLQLLVIFISVFLCMHNLAAGQNDTITTTGRDTVRAQINSPTDNQYDDEFNLFLFAYAAAALGAVAGAIIVGTAVAATAVLLAILFISAGIVSASLLAGFYKRSIAAGFKTFIIIICIIGGTVIGSVGLYVVAKIFTLRLSNQAAFFSGAAGGFVGGMIMGLIIYRLLLFLVGYIKRRLQIL